MRRAILSFWLSFFLGRPKVPIDRPVGSPLGKVYLVSTCGADFAARIHDIDDVKIYVKNWSKVLPRYTHSLSLSSAA